MKVKIKTPKIKKLKCSYGKVLGRLEAIDIGVKSGKYTERQHKALSLKALTDCLKVR